MNGLHRARLRWRRFVQAAGSLLSTGVTITGAAINFAAITCAAITSATFTGTVIAQDTVIAEDTASAPAEPIVDFANDIIPVLTKAGCNTGACHGAAIGRGGFKLSLYGSDPDQDYRAIVEDLEGRRINLAKPDASLIVLKPTESISHGGGYRLDEDGAGAERLRSWIQQGATHQSNKRLTAFTVAPQRQWLATVESTVPLSATATFSDASTVEVTPWTVFVAEDPDAVVIDPETSLATVRRRGRHLVIARYLEHVVPIELIVPWSDDEGLVTAAPSENFIDELVAARLEQLRLPVSPPASDEAFLRRVSLDLTGCLPTIETIDDYVHSDDPHKRRRLVDRLLQSDAFVDYWTLQLAKLFRMRSHGDDREGLAAYHAWLKQCVAQGTAYDEMVTTLITAAGDTHVVGPANFYRTVSGAREQAELFSEVLMGSRLRCANCHNHPLDRWTQDDYHGLAAIFAKVRSGRVVSVASQGEVTHPRTGEAARLRIPGHSFLVGQGDEREQLAAWITDPENPYFAKAFVNRLWKALLGRGLVEPSDDFRSTNPATHPELLERLAEDFVDHDFQLRHSLRRIALSATYARGAAVQGNELDETFYSHTRARRLQPEVLADAISDVLGLQERYGEEPLGTRAVTLVDHATPSPTLDVLGRCSRTESCESSAHSTVGLTQMLHLINGPLLNQRIAALDNRLSERVTSGVDPPAIASEFYQRALSRKPSAVEQRYWNDALAATSPESVRWVLEDFLWSLLNSHEFTTNH